MLIHLIAYGQSDLILFVCIHAEDRQEGSEGWNLLRLLAKGHCFLNREGSETLKMPLKFSFRFHMTFIPVYSHLTMYAHRVDHVQESLKFLKG